MEVWKVESKEEKEEEIVAKDRMQSILPEVRALDNLHLGSFRPWHFPQVVIP
jgi:hypothetical protein